jgi:hypothetical protein
MEPYDIKSALDELKEDAVLPHPVRLRDMILRIPELPNTLRRNAKSRP